MSFIDILAHLEGGYYPEERNPQTSLAQIDQGYYPPIQERLPAPSVPLKRVTQADIDEALAKLRNDLKQSPHDAFSRIAQME